MVKNNDLIERLSSHENETVRAALAAYLDENSFPEIIQSFLEEDRDNLVIQMSLAQNTSLCSQSLYKLFEINNDVIFITLVFNPATNSDLLMKLLHVVPSQAFVNIVDHKNTTLEILEIIINSGVQDAVIKAVNRVCNF